ncbi:WD40-repeat-containing domain protein [Thelephora terrestris]|uniref:WD40-repeat-containing domain protein n=1 Tax=Thelephora terrestris TaxID=56493 RepID=A0A9P6HPI9_9AGAM|nr:WD40-repeat-containing domain protein [Thelephora terrestris]
MGLVNSTEGAYDLGVQDQRWHSQSRCPGLETRRHDPLGALLGPGIPRGKYHDVSNASASRAMDSNVRASRTSVKAGIHTNAHVSTIPSPDSRLSAPRMTRASTGTLLSLLKMYSGRMSAKDEGLIEITRGSISELSGGKGVERKVREMTTGLGEGTEADGAKLRKPKRTLRNHLDAIRIFDFHTSKLCLASGSDDNTIKLWRMDVATLASSACGAEGTVKVWEITAAGGNLKLSWSYNGLNDHGEVIKVEGNNEDAPGVTVVEALKMDLNKVAVAYQNMTVKIFDIETGKEEMKLQPEIVADEGVSTQINALASHLMMPLLVTGHEDKYIRIFDISTCQCTHSMLARLEGVTCLSIDPAGFTLVSGGHDGSVRFWVILGSKACVHDINVHREKAREGVLAVEFHQSLPFVASAGADGIIKLYSSS